MSVFGPGPPNMLSLPSPPSSTAGGMVTGSVLKSMITTPSGPSPACTSIEPTRSSESVSCSVTFAPSMTVMLTASRPTTPSKNSMRIASPSSGWSVPSMRSTPSLRSRVAVMAAARRVRSSSTSSMGRKRRDECWSLWARDRGPWNGFQAISVSRRIEGLGVVALNAKSAAKRCHGFFRESTIEWKSGFGLELLVQPGLGVRPVPLGRAHGDAERLGGVGDGQAGKVAQVDQALCLGVFRRQPGQGLVVDQRQELPRGVWIALLERLQQVGDVAHEYQRYPKTLLDTNRTQRGRSPAPDTSHVPD